MEKIQEGKITTSEGASFQIYKEKDTREKYLQVDPIISYIDYCPGHKRKLLSELETSESTITFEGKLYISISGLKDFLIGKTKPKAIEVRRALVESARNNPTLPSTSRQQDIREKTSRAIESARRLRKAAERHERDLKELNESLNNMSLYRKQ